MLVGVPVPKFLEEPGIDRAATLAVVALYFGLGGMFVLKGDNQKQDNSPRK